MALAMEQDESPHPVNVRLLGAVRVVEGPNGVAHLIEKANAR
jgi:hypothetical protein